MKFLVVSAIEAKYVIVKGVSIVIGIGYSITIMRGEHWHALMF